MNTKNPIINNKRTNIITSKKRAEDVERMEEALRVIEEIKKIKQTTINKQIKNTSNENTSNEEEALKEIIGIANNIILKSNNNRTKIITAKKRAADIERMKEALRVISEISKSKI